MPQYQSTTFDRFVNPAQLCSPPVILHDQDIVSHEQVGFFGLDSESPFSIGPDHTTWKPELSAMCTPSPWLPRNSMTMASVQFSNGYNSSSASSSPSPPGSVIQEQHQKRRAQNRAAQRAYRERKMRYLVDLEQGIREIEQKMSKLQGENTELIRQLCETRQQNVDIREARQSPQSRATSVVRRLQDGRRESSSSKSSSRASPLPLARTLNVGDISIADLARAKGPELESLYEPFAAMWNLIRIDPSVVEGNVSAATILERLKGMAEIEGENLRSSSSRSYSTSSSIGTPTPANSPI